MPLTGAPFKKGDIYYEEMDQPPAGGPDVAGLRACDHGRPDHRGQRGHHPQLQELCLPPWLRLQKRQQAGGRKAGQRLQAPGY